MPETTPEMIADFRQLMADTYAQTGETPPDVTDEQIGKAIQENWPDDVEEGEEAPFGFCPTGEGGGVDPSCGNGSQGDWESSLTKNQTDAITQWAQDRRSVRAFRMLAAGQELPIQTRDNPSGFREDDAEKLREQFGHFEQAIADAPNFEGTARRVMDSVAPGSFEVGKEFEMNGYTSTARNPETIKNYLNQIHPDEAAGLVLMDVKMKTGADISKAVDKVDGKNWDEVLVRPGARFRTTQTEPTTVNIGGRNVQAMRVVVEEISDDGIEFARVRGHNRSLPTGKEIAAVLKRLFERQRKKVLAKLTSSTVVFAELPLKFTPIADWDEEFAEEVKPLLEVYYKRGTRHMIGRVGASPDLFSVVSPHIRHAVDKAAMAFSRSTNDTTSLHLNDALKKLRSELAEGLLQGDPLDALRDRVNEIFDQATQSRAQIIAASEASRALNHGNQIAAKESGVVARKKWLLSDDACPEVCQPIADTQPDEGIDLDANFLSGDGPYGDVPYPPAHPSCMCSIEYVLTPDYQQAIGE